MDSFDPERREGGDRRLSSTPLSPGSPLERTPGQKKLAFLCGNGTLDRFLEECDDGNVQDFDGCSHDCHLEQGICGDGIVQLLLDEQCEPPLFDPSAPFSCKNCRLVSRACGDGAVDPGEECDQGGDNSDVPGSLCRTDCSFARPGDGIVDSSEESCDDGNKVGGDGCDRFGRLESSTPPFAQRAYEPMGVIAPPYAFLPPYQQSLLLPSLPPRLPEQPKTGPEILVVMAVGAAGGLAYMRKLREMKNGE